VGLADDIKNYQPPQRSCLTCDWYEELDAEDRAAVDAWLESDGAYAPLYRIAAKNGCPTALSSFRACMRDHRRTA